MKNEANDQNQFLNNHNLRDTTWFMGFFFQASPLSGPTTKKNTFFAAYDCNGLYLENSKTLDYRGSNINLKTNVQDFIS